jgi:hypothetical protein
MRTKFTFEIQTTDGSSRCEEEEDARCAGLSGVEIGKLERKERKRRLASKKKSLVI